MLVSRRLFVVAIVACGGISPFAAVAQDDEDSPFRPGLVATYSAGAVSATSIDEDLAFDWQDASPDPRLPAGEFSAKWRGKLWTKSSGKHLLQCYVQGDVEIKLLGRTVIEGKATEPQWLVSDPIDVEFGRHELEITFRKTGPRAQLALFWSGPDFRLEPIPERALLHDREGSPSSQFERGRQLAAALRCAACHKDPAADVTPAPALDRLTGNIAEPWLVDWLSSHASDTSAKETLRRMPDVTMTREEATAVAAWLLREPAVKTEQKAIEQKETEETKGKRSGKKGKGEEEKPKPSAAEGKRLLLTRGCLACHQLGSLGESGWFGGGDLTALVKKRPADFLVRWLENPAAINRSHRMPVFTFTTDELKSLSLWSKLQAEKSAADSASKQNKRPELIRQGEELVGLFRCANCHVVSRDKSDLTAAPLAALAAASNWSRSCGGESDRAKLRPGYRLAAEDQAALKAYYSQPRPGEDNLSPQARGRDLLVQLNCLACHQREGVDRNANALPARLQDKLAAVAEAHDQLAPLVPAMTPPALNSVGDKLHDAALAEAISRQGPPHRPYLLVQMPKFALGKDQLAALSAYFTATDRIPSVGNALRGVPPAADDSQKPAAITAAGPRLVTTDGLACASCHQIGSVPPVKAPINARGPNLSMTGKRIRREWFDRFCADPARIVPRMEMPSVKVPIRGVLSEKIEDQLAAVWHILNTPGFEPPEPNPVRVLRLSGVPERNERPIVIHDVMKDGDKTYLFPLVIGLPNRHNILFDLETNRLAAWWLGDTARQRTKGKSWYWETGGKSILEPGFEHAEIVMMIDGKEWIPRRVGQSIAQLNSYAPKTQMDGLLGDISGGASGVSIRYQLSFVPAGVPQGEKAKERVIDVAQSIASYAGAGFFRLIELHGTGKVDSILFRLIDPRRFHRVDGGTLKAGDWTFDIRGWHLPNGAGTVPGGSRMPLDGSEGFKIEYESENRWKAFTNLTYESRFWSDRYVAEPPPETPVASSEVRIAPGLMGTRLPLPDDIMPSAISWRHPGILAFGTLKGELYSTDDSNDDGTEDTVHRIVDGLATPYGLNATPDFFDVAVKGGVVRVADGDETRKSVRIDSIASGWGHTEDYHDWAVGLVPGDQGEYYLALPCQQDQRTDEAARYRGRLLKLVPRLPTFDNRQLFGIEVVSSGHRFPMGLARNRDGELFVTDNQGNYNPFNELNHVRQGAHFGFINALEKEKGYKPPRFDEPAIDIPHPWTRSVNGICFLDTPVGWDQRAQLAPAHQRDTKERDGGPAAAKAALSHPTKSIFGPLEGHLVGCEYDTRRLIRMSLQKVGDTYQGAAYPLSIPTEDVEKGLLGPIVCAVKPTTGELYVGEIRDSGWGAGNNIGQIVKIKIEPDKLPCGIAEVRATATGFTIDFFQPVDRAKAMDAASYSISSYRRESTPAYGGNDIDRRTESIKSIALDDSGKRVTLTLPELRAGHSYELKLKNLAPGGGVFHPDEAHYTLRRIPR